MSSAEKVLAVIKVIIAAAWADGSIDHAEINSLKDLLFQLPEITANDWASLEIYLDAPIQPSERQRLADELQRLIRKPEDKSLALDALDRIIQADGVITEEEEKIADEIREVIDAVDVGLLPNLGRLIRGPVKRRTESIASSPNREHFLADFVKNRIYYQVSRRLDQGDLEIDLTEEELRKLSLAGGLLARVAYVDRDVTPEEHEVIVKSLEKDWGLSKTNASIVAEIAVSEISEDMDFFRLNREFFISTTLDERLRFVEALFSLARADGEASHQEIEEIRLIANGLKLSHRQFIASKMKDA